MAAGEFVVKWSQWGWRAGVLTGASMLVVFSLVASTSADSPPSPPPPPAAAQAAGAPSAEEMAFYRANIEPYLMLGRGGTMPGYGTCVMCHTWQVSPMRFSLETPEAGGWTPEQSSSNFGVITQLVDTSDPESSRLLRKPLSPEAGGLDHTGGTFWESTEDPEYQAVLSWISSLPDDRFVPPAAPELDFAFYRACVQQVFANPRTGQIHCGECHGANGLDDFAPVPSNGRLWNDEEAQRGFAKISRLIIPGNPEQSRFMLKPLHQDGGGIYAHNGPRRWQTRDDPEWQMLAEWIRGDRTGNSCSY
jgi:hypothetical protein